MKTKRGLRNTIAVCTLCMLLHTPTMAGNQLYTGDASTVPAGRYQFQLFQDSTPNRAYRFGGTSLTYGAFGNVDIRAAYGRLWSDISPDARIGPNIGVKWRFVGDGRIKPSMAVSGLYSRTRPTGRSGNKPDYGALLIASSPSKYATFLGNFGRVWVGEQRPDLYYLSLAAVRRVSVRTIVAFEYSDLKRIGHATDQGVDKQYATGIVYAPDARTSYSLQVGYLPSHPKFHFRTTLGYSVYFQYLFVLREPPDWNLLPRVRQILQNIAIEQVLPHRRLQGAHRFQSRATIRLAITPSAAPAPTPMSST